MYNKLNVLIVEDEPLIAIFIKRTVQQFGSNVIDICYDSEDALQKVKQHKPDIVFMDINIKGPLDGISVTRKIKMECEPLIVYITAYNDHDTVDEALSTNPYNYIVKPVKETDIKVVLSLAKKEIKKLKVNEELNNCIYFKDGSYFDLDKKEIFSNKNPISLTKIEKHLLDMFITNKNTTISLESIKVKVWHDKDVSDTTIRDKISVLRKKLPQLKIKTSFGIGYCLEYDA